MSRKAPDAGELNRRVTIQTRRDTESGDYSVMETRTNKATAPVVWAKIANVSGTQQVDSRNAAAGITHRITIRYRSDISKQDEILYTSRQGQYRYEIQTIQNAGDEDNLFLVLECNQQALVGELANPSPEPAE